MRMSNLKSASAVVSISVFLLFRLSVDSATITVKTSKDLQNALDNAKPGDIVELSANTIYSGKFKATKKGNADAPITLRGPRNAVLDGGTVKSGYVLHLNGAKYMTVEGLTVKNGSKGIMLDGSTHCVLDNVFVTQIGDEGVHFRKNSSDNVIRNSLITNTGVVRPGVGEGIYVGSSGEIKSYEERDASDRVKILNNQIGPGVRAECVDIKEGTRDGEISGNTFDGTDLSDENFADSWIDVKGSFYKIRNNKGVKSLKNGFEVHVRRPGWGEGNVFDGNDLDVQGPGYAIFIQKKGLESFWKSNIVYSNNKYKNAALGLANVAVTSK